MRKTAITQLMGAYATREDAVDELLRRKVSANFHTVVRKDLLAGLASRSRRSTPAAFTRPGDLRSELLAQAEAGYRGADRNLHDDPPGDLSELFRASGRAGVM